MDEKTFEELDQADALAAFQTEPIENFVLLFAEKSVKIMRKSDYEKLKNSQ